MMSSAQRELEWQEEAIRRLTASEASKQNFIKQLQDEMAAYTTILAVGITEEEKAEGTTFHEAMRHLHVNMRAYVLHKRDTL